jgi:lysyl-tRNA synthetase class 2
MYLRIAPELYLKRLVVGGFERVYEINRNFPQRGPFDAPQPEFTMLELYQAYADYRDFMDMVERMFQGVADAICGTRRIEYQGEVFDFGSAFRRVTVEDLVVHFTPGIERGRLRDVGYLREACTRLGIQVKPRGRRRQAADRDLREDRRASVDAADVRVRLSCGSLTPGASQRLRPVPDGSLRVLCRRSRNRQRIFRAERCRGPGRTFPRASGTHDAGDDEAMFYDADYIRALEYGMPPAAGLGIGVDRMVMLFTNQPSIRDVLLFPHMKPE